ncbi:MAG TPA: PKD domain-containing protein, partial [Chitinophagaceae bacterium]|nr:PKD domain-containing protein [Chitinophagaceae bacterium]
MRTVKTVLWRVLFLVILYPLSYPAMAQFKADFTSSSPSGCAPLVVKFTDASQGGPVSYKWDLGNGVISADANPSTSYFTPGTYNVKLTVYNADGADSVIKAGYVTVYKNPVAAFSVSDSSGCFPLHVNYIDRSIPGSGSIANHTWDFGDGNISYAEQPSHSYTEPGTFSVTLTVTNTYGCSSTASSSNLVHISHGVHAGYSADTTQVCHTPAVIKFAQTATGDGTLSYKWAFGDGGASTEAKPSHNYNSAGVYKALLTVTSNLGCSDTVSKTINIAFVKSAININDSVCLNQQVQFINAASPAASSSVWSFGDGTSSNAINPGKAYKAPGEYSVKVINTFFAGCVDSAARKITVVAGAMPAFTTSDTAGCSLPYIVHFKNTTPGTGITYAWDFGDGTTSSEVSPVHEFTKFGSYNVTLKALNGGGCRVTATLNNAVTIQPVKITGIRGLIAGCAPLKITPAVKTNVSVPITKYYWDFGDGTVSSDASPAHTYSKEGIYRVFVKIETVSGCVDSLTLNDSVGHKVKPAFTFTPAAACASKEVSFTNTTAEATTTLLWYLGDGTVVYNQPQPSHNYKDTGYFDVMLVTVYNGCLDTLVKPKAVHIAAPIASFKANNECNNRLRITLNNKSIGDVTRTWDFGDGSFDTSKSPVHIYNLPGQYNIKLTVNNGACSYTTNSNVKIV